MTIHNLLCYTCGKKLFESDREDYPTHLNIHYTCKDHGLQVTVSTNKEKYTKWGKVVEDDSRSA